MEKAYNVRQINPGTLQVFNAATGEQYFSINIGTAKRTQGVIVSGNTLSINFEDGTFQTWDLKHKQRLR